MDCRFDLCQQSAQSEIAIRQLSRCQFSAVTLGAAPRRAVVEEVARHFSYRLLAGCDFASQISEKQIRSLRFPLYTVCAAVDRKRKIARKKNRPPINATVR